MNRRWRLLSAAMPAALVLFALPASASDKGDFAKAQKTWQAALQKAAAAEAAFWREAPRRLRDAYDLYRRQWVEWYGKPDAPPDIFYDLTGYKVLYGEAGELGLVQGTAAVSLAASANGLEAARALWKQLAAVTELVVKADKQVKDARVVQDDYHIDQQIPLRRVSLEGHRLGLIEALGKLSDPEAQAFLTGKAWEEACGADKKNGDVRHRLALVDAMGSSRTEAAFSFLQARRSEPALFVRMAALEGIAKFKDARPAEVLEAALSALKDEKAFPIRLQALGVIEAMKAVKAAGALIDALRAEVEAKEGGVICGHIVRILRDLTGKDYGLNWENWKGWYEKHREELEKGSTAKEGAGDPAAGDKKEKTVTFYNIPTYSKGIIILIDASDTLIIPADVDIAKRHNIFYWLEASNKKLEEYRSQLEVLKEEAAKAIEGMDDHTFFNVVLLYKDNRKDACWPAMMPATAENKKKALKMFMDVKAGGWAPQFDGLLEAYRIAGMDPYATEFEAPAADTFYLLTDGGICGGRWMTPNAILEAVKKLNRFRRAAIHTIQIADLGPDAVELLRGLADATGGTYVWRKR